MIFSQVCDIVAQPTDPVTEPQEPAIATPVDKIMESSGGNVEIIIDTELLENILDAPHGKVRQRNPHRNPTIRPGLNRVKGYRIQVFSDGRNQSTLESRARARGNAIVAKFPKYRGQVYTNSYAPNWVTRVGNFQTSAEAQAAMNELKAAFPAFGAEMRIISSDIYVVR